MADSNAAELPRAQRALARAITALEALETALDTGLVASVLEAKIALAEAKLKEAEANLTWVEAGKPNDGPFLDLAVATVRSFAAAQDEYTRACAAAGAANTAATAGAAAAEPDAKRRRIEQAFADDFRHVCASFPAYLQLRANETTEMPTFTVVEPSTMVRRQCYIDMAPLVLTPRVGDTLVKTLVFGNPGTGKSIFAHELVAQLMTPAHPAILPAEIVLYVSSLTGVALQWTREGNIFEAITYTDQIKSACLYLRGPTHWVIYDAANSLSPVPLQFVKCNHITLTSSNDDIINCQFLKSTVPYAKKVFMPPFSLAEATCARPATVPQEKLEARFREFGGIARALLLTNMEPEAVARIDRPGDLLQYIDTIKAKNAVDKFSYTKNNNVLAVYPTVNDDETVDYYRPTVDFVSEAAKLNIMAVEQQLDADSRGKFVELVRGVPAAASLCGAIFESHAHALLAQGGEFDLRLLTAVDEPNGPTIKMTIPARVRYEFDTLADLTAGKMSTSFCVPTIGNFPAIDSLSDYRGPGAANSAVLTALAHPGGAPVQFDLLSGFQVTVGDKHSVNPTGLQAFADKFVDSYALVFVVPTWMETHWRNLQRYKSKVNGSTVIPSDKVTQLALFLPFP